MPDEIASSPIHHEQIYGGFKPFRFAAVSDPHISTSTLKTPSSQSNISQESVLFLKAVVKEINTKHHVDFVVVTGDLTKNNKSQEMEKFKEIIDELEPPYYIVPGNEDCSAEAEKTKDEGSMGFCSQWGWMFQGHGFNGSLEHWSLDPVKGVHLIGLDLTIVGDWGGCLTKNGLNWLDRDLAANKDKFTFIIMHHLLVPLTEPEKTGENDFNKFVAYNADEIKGILRKYPNVRLTLSGHRHLSARFIKEGGITYFHVPSTMTWPMQYVIFDVTPGEIYFKSYWVPCSEEARVRALKNHLDSPINAWPRWREIPNTPEGNKKFKEIHLQESTLTGVIPLIK